MAEEETLTQHEDTNSGWWHHFRLLVCQIWCWFKHLSGFYFESVCPYYVWNNANLSPCAMCKPWCSVITTVIDLAFFPCAADPNEPSEGSKVTSVGANCPSSRTAEELVNYTTLNFYIWGIYTVHLQWFYTGYQVLWCSFNSRWVKPKISLNVRG